MTISRNGNEISIKHQLARSPHANATTFFSYSKQSEQLLRAIPDNCVIIRIWHHDYSVLADKRVTGETIAGWFAGQRGDVGHASIQTAKHYMSIWPGTVLEKNGPGQKALKLSKAGFLDDYTAHNGISTANAWLLDAKLTTQHHYHHSPVPTTICLYNLNVAAIDHLYEQMKASGKINFTMLGLSPMANDHNCATFVFALLKAGGIRNLLFRPESAVRTQQVTTNMLLFENTATRPYRADVIQTEKYHNEYHTKQDEIKEWERTYEYIDMPGTLNDPGKRCVLVKKGTKEEVSKFLYGKPDESHYRDSPSNGLALLRARDPNDIKTLVTYAKKNDLLLSPNSTHTDSFKHREHEKPIPAAANETCVVL